MYVKIIILIILIVIFGILVYCEMFYNGRNKLFLFLDFVLKIEFSILYVTIDFLFFKYLVK